METVMRTFREITKKNVLTIDEKSKRRHLSQNKILVRDRINKLLDDGSAFLEFSQLAGFEVYPGEIVPAGGIITGIGKVSGYVFKFSKI